MNKYIVSALLIISFTIGIGAGYTLTPEYVTMKDKGSAMEPLGVADRFIDLRYLKGVIAHHLTAIDLAEQALEQSHREEIRNLAKEIIKSDKASIEELESWKSSWYKDDRQVSQFVKINLGTNDGKFDLRFLNALITHHDEAIMTTKEISGKSVRNEVLNLADSINTGLTANKVILEKWRSEWYSL